MDESDVERLCVRYSAMVLRRCRRLLGGEDEARDACQDVFVRVVAQGSRLHDTYPSSLLYRIATNVCLNRIRDRARRPAPGGDELLHRLACAEEPGAGSHARVLLERLFGRHLDSTRTIAVMHYVDGLTLEEVAAACGLSVSGVRRRLRKLRETLKELSDDQPPR